MVYLPYLNTKEAFSLTPAQWDALGVRAFAVDIALLWQRFGIHPRFKLNQFAMPWATFWLDLRALDFIQSDYAYRSLDGRLQHVEMSSLRDWVEQLGGHYMVYRDEDFGDYQPSHLPLQDAMSGLFYHQSQTLSIVDEQFTRDFSPLSPTCSCATCLQGATRGYLHYLFQHTPLLAQRYLIIHNVKACIQLKKY